MIKVQQLWITTVHVYRLILFYFTNLLKLSYLPFYRAMLRRARYCCRMSSVRLLSVCPSVTFRYRDHIRWNSLKITSRPNSLRPWLFEHPTWATWCKGNTPKLGLNWGGVTLHGRKPAISPKRCEIRPRLLLRTNRNSYTRFRMVPKSVTLGDLEGRIQWVTQVFYTCAIISGTSKATDFYFGLYIQRVHPNKRPQKFSEKWSEGVSRGCQKFWGTPYYLRNGLSYGLLVWLIHSQGPSEQKAIKILWLKEAWAYPGDAKSF